MHTRHHQHCLQPSPPPTLKHTHTQTRRTHTYTNTISPRLRPPPSPRPPPHYTTRHQHSFCSEVRMAECVRLRSKLVNGEVRRKVIASVFSIRRRVKDGVYTVCVCVCVCAKWVCTALCLCMRVCVLGVFSIRRSVKAGTDTHTHTHAHTRHTHARMCTACTSTHIHTPQGLKGCAPRWLLSDMKETEQDFEKLCWVHTLSLPTLNLP